VNPRETEVLGEKAYGSLEEIPDPVDIVDVFRRAEDTPPIADQAVRIGAKALWLQTGISSEEAASRAEAGGLPVSRVAAMPEQSRRAVEAMACLGGRAKLSVLEIAIIVLSFALMGALFFIMNRTQIGRALRAIAESPKAAALLGINVEGLFLLTSFTAAALGGVAGVLIALYSNAVFPLMGQPILHKGIAVIILGGMGDIRGALVGAMFLGFAEVLSVAYIGSTMRDAVGFGLLFLVLLLRPQGLFGKVLERKA
jgi:branched-subunit amino acid ABC-type transport system permease component